MIGRAKAAFRHAPRARALLALLAVGWVGFAVAACDSGEPMGGGSDPGDETGTSAATTTTTTTGSSTGGTTDTGGSGEESSTEQPDGSCASLSKDACLEAADCLFAEAMEVDSSAECGLSNLFRTELCLDRGPSESSTRTAYYAEVDGVLRFLVRGSSACYPSLRGTPAPSTGWMECTNAPGEPELCHCLCGANGCPNSAPAQALETCEVETPCGEMVEHQFGENLGEYVTCVLEALRDRSPGYFPLVVRDDLFLDETRVYATGGDQVHMVRQYSNDVACRNAHVGDWGPAMDCTLQPPAFFEDCLQEGEGDSHQCLLASRWFTDCEEVEPTCP